MRLLVERAIKSGDSSQAGISALPGSLMLELRWLVQRVQEGDRASAAGPGPLVHPRHDDRASLRNLHYLQANLSGPTPDGGVPMTVITW